MTTPTKKSRPFARRDVNRDEYIDKLRQRWLVERAAVSLYTRVLARLAGDGRHGALVPQLERFRDQEATHAAMLEQLLAELGCDPRYEPATPEVNIGASEMATLLELANGPELTSDHLLEVLLLAERFDGVGWELLIDEANEAELDEECLRSFRAASRDEAEHERVLRAEVWRSIQERLHAAGGHLSG
jgi:rubrerythrin